MDGSFIPGKIIAKNLWEYKLVSLQCGAFLFHYLYATPKTGWGFDEINNTLLLFIACLCPNNLFAIFKKDKLTISVEYYPNNFYLV